MRVWLAPSFSSIVSIRSLNIINYQRISYTQNKYFLNPKDEDDDPYESSQMDLFIANRYGIFGVFSLREIDEYEKFWSIGSGSDYALGAMYAAYDQFEEAEEIARIGVEAGIEFDDGSDAPITAYNVDLI